MGPKDKKCKDCEEVKPLDQFYIANKKYGTRQPYCCQCSIKRSQARIKSEKHYQRWRFLVRGGVDCTYEEVKALFDKYTACQICGSTIQLVADHCHDTKRLRGVLCSECNFGLGKFKDDVHSLQQAIYYLKGTS